MTLRFFMTGIAALTLTACSNASNTAETITEAAETAVTTEQNGQDITTTVAKTLQPDTEQVKAPSLEDILNAQDDAYKARYGARNPQATLEYVGIEPGMSVAEVLPGGGWYTKLLLPYLGEKGEIIGVDYDLNMWKKFEGFATPEFLEKRKSWAQTWSKDASEWRKEGDATIKATSFGSIPKDMKNTIDVIFIVRALHHLNRFDQAHWDSFIKDSKAILKPGGHIAIVQHRGPEGNDDVWANGDNGYLKQSYVIEQMQKAGFELAKEPSEINANPKDQPNNEDMIWRLPPTLGTSRNDPELKAKMEAIGETDRMTLLFRVAK